MRQVTTEELGSPARALDPEVLEFRAQFSGTSALDELVRQGAQQMLQSAIELEVEDFLAQHAERRDALGPAGGGQRCGWGAGGFDERPLEHPNNDSRPLYFTRFADGEERPLVIGEATPAGK